MLSTDEHNIELIQYQRYLNCEWIIQHLCQKELHNNWPNRLKLKRRCGLQQTRTMRSKFQEIDVNKSGKFALGMHGESKPVTPAVTDLAETWTLEIIWLMGLFLLCFPLRTTSLIITKPHGLAGANGAIHDMCPMHVPAQLSHGAISCTLSLQSVFSLIKLNLILWSFRLFFQFRTAQNRNNNGQLQRLQREKPVPMWLLSLNKKCARNCQRHFTHQEVPNIQTDTHNKNG